MIPKEEQQAKKALSDCDWDDDFEKELYDALVMCVAAAIREAVEEAANKRDKLAELLTDVEQTKTAILADARRAMFKEYEPYLQHKHGCISENLDPCPCGLDELKKREA